MQIYGDPQYRITAKIFLANFLQRLRRTRADNLDDVRALLIQAGQFEQAMADAGQNASSRTDLAAQAFYKCWKGERPSISTVDMGKPRFAWNEVPLAKKFEDTRAIDLGTRPMDEPTLHSPSALSMGNPHAIFWVDDVGAYDLGKIGPSLETHPIFPERANISLAQVASRARLVVRTWERGAGLTKACGSAACAAAVAAARLGLVEREVTVALPGGELRIEWRVQDDHVLMTGPVAYEYEGKFDPALFKVRASR